jgi:FecR protein
MRKPSLLTTCALVGSLAIAGAALAADEIGRVSAVAGEATAQQPGAEPRSLACGDPVFAGDTLRTGSDSHVGVQLDDVATHLDANSQVVVDRTAENTPSARLLAGKVRMIDPRDEGEAAQLSALDADAQVQGNDAEAYIFSEKVGPYAMLCEWDAPLPVSRGRESKTIDPGQCVIAKPKEPLYTANAHDTRIPAIAQECAPGPGLASLNNPLHHLSPTDVAAIGPVPDNFKPPVAAVAPAYVCDQAAVCSPAIPIEVVEPPPVIEPCPPGFCP